MSILSESTVFFCFFFVFVFLFFLCRMIFFLHIFFVFFSRVGLIFFLHTFSVFVQDNDSFCTCFFVFFCIFFVQYRKD